MQTLLVQFNLSPQSVNSITVKMLLLSFLLIFSLLVYNSDGQKLPVPGRNDTASMMRMLNTIAPSLKDPMSQWIRADLAETELKLQKLAPTNGKLNQDVVCGLGNGPSSISSRIIGGTEASPNEFPWQVYLIAFTSSGPFSGCGATLIDSQWVLTAAHCFDQGVVSVVVYLGGHEVSVGSSETNRIALKSDQFYIHPQYDPVPNTPDKDIALIRLSIEITFNDYIRPVCLPDSFESDHIDDPVTITGWGKTWAYTGERSPVLLKARSKVTTSWRCSKMLPNYFDTDSVICIDGLHYDSKSTNPCEGDSGGPLNFQDDDGIWTTIGIASYGAPSCTGYVSVYTRTSSYLGWIYSYVKNSPRISMTTSAPTTSAPTTKAYRNQANNYLSGVSFSLIIFSLFISLFLF